MSISCKEVTRLISEGQDRDLSLAERAQLQVHFAICRGCRAVNEQMQFLRRAVRNLFERNDPPQS